MAVLAKTTARGFVNATVMTAPGRQARLTAFLLPAKRAINSATMISNLPAMK